jgi:imidazolonepropionase-like amidohydrolase
MSRTSWRRTRPPRERMHMKLSHRLVFVFVALFTALAQAQQAPTRPMDLALKNVKLSDAENVPLSTVIVRNGRIADIVGAQAEVPADVRVVDAHSFLLKPAFIDAYTFAGCVTPQPVVDRDIAPRTASDVVIDMREADRKGIEPAFHAASAYKLEDDPEKAYRNAGFGALASSPHGQLLSGVSALATTREAAPRDVFLASELFDTMGFDATGPGYPSTPMGAMAQLRQFFWDAQRQAELLERRKSGKQVSRLPYDEDFLAVQPALAKSRRFLCEADTAAQIDRFLALSDELGFQIAISGGREAWKRADVLKARGVPVFLSLQWGEEPEDPHKKPDAKGDAKPDVKKDAKPDSESKPDADTDAKPDQKPADKPDVPTEGRRGRRGRGGDRADSGVDAKKDTKKDEWTYEEPLRVREEKRRLWEETRDGAQVLAKAGVAIAFGSGKDSPKELVERVRTMVEHGLPIDVAWQGLTSGAASMLGVDHELGKAEKGFDASLALWSKDPLRTKDAKLGWLLVDGFLFTFDRDDELTGKPGEGIDATGKWKLEFDSTENKPASADLKMDKDGKVTGSVTFKSPADDSDLTGDFEGHVAAKRILLNGHVKIGGFEAEVVIDGKMETDAIEGETRWKFSGGEQTRKFKASRAPKGGL